MLDRITLKGMLPTATAQNFFEERMKRSARCSAEPVSQTTDTRPPRPPRRTLNRLWGLGAKTAPEVAGECGPLVLVDPGSERVWCDAIGIPVRI
jgi:hypothetical protein